MLPDGVLSTQTILGDILPPRDIPKELRIDYEMGPVAISDPSQGMSVKVWTGFLDEGWLTCEADDVSPTHIFEAPSTSELSLTFDQNGRPCFGYTDDSGVHLYWFNTLNNDFEVLDVGITAYNPRVILDDKREFNIANNDILFFYIINGALCVRYQRERFATEHILSNIGANTVLDNVGMNSEFRIQLMLRVAA